MAKIKPLKIWFRNHKETGNRLSRVGGGTPPRGCFVGRYEIATIRFNDHALSDGSGMYIQYMGYKSDEEKALPGNNPNCAWNTFTLKFRPKNVEEAEAYLQSGVITQSADGRELFMGKRKIRLPDPKY